MIGRSALWTPRRFELCVVAGLSSDFRLLAGLEETVLCASTLVQVRDDSYSNIRTLT